MGVLKGCRILDLGIITAGAATSALLADLGAEVIKIESPSYRDPFRAWIPDGPAMSEGAMSPFFRATNRNKRGLSLDLKQPAGRKIMLRLAASSHGLVENFRRGVLERLGLGYETLAGVNPGLVLGSISSQGETGPDSHYVSYGSTLEAVAGMAWHTGYDGDAPVVSGRDVNYPDQVVAIFAASMIVSALHEARATGQGAHLDLSQRELTSYLIGETFISAKDEAAPRIGNADAPYLVQDCFRSADGEWVAVSLEHRDRSKLHQLIGAPEGAHAQQCRQALLDWIGARQGHEAVALLVDAGIAAATAMTGDRLMSETARLWNMAIIPGGDDGGWFKGFPVQLVNQPLAIDRDAPEVGADSRTILSELAGYTDPEIDQFAEEGVIELAD
ncbi:CaiB/BaiF CoA transferase family protein [Cucumibacter marinus]|uniref:CaiB/BaiF CoA transferase family protein n=1 Tax=Cucumibacter marinus TaxID=1121252 RepID=UPI0004089DAD|nr:CaiB/BaiF CoA-transferase family protein [Cucumibacter marinus]